MKKVFSVEALKLDKNSPPTTTALSIASGWTQECEGLTEEELNAIGYEVQDNWMIEVEDNNES